MKKKLSRLIKSATKLNGQAMKKRLKMQIRSIVVQGIHSLYNVDVMKSPGGVLPYKRLMGMCRWIGSHFHDWIDYNGVAFSIELLEWGRTSSDFLG